MQKIQRALVPVILLFFLLPGLRIVHAQAQGTGPIYGIWFYQQQDDVKIVYLNHQDDHVTDEYFGTQYTDAAIQGCINQGDPPGYLVRYRQEPDSTWVVYCYTDQTVYVVIPGAVFGQDTIDAAVARAQQIVYPCIVPGERKGENV